MFVEDYFFAGYVSEDYQLNEYHHIPEHSIMSFEYMQPSNKAGHVVITYKFPVKINGKGALPFTLWIKEFESIILDYRFKRLTKPEYERLTPKCFGQ